MITVLGLHGYRQNGELMSKKLTKIFGAQVNLICPTGPYYSDNTDNSKRGWWQLESKEMFTQEHTYLGYNEALSEINKLLTTVDTIDFLIGFSQGAVFTTLLLANDLLISKNVKGVILISGSPIMDISLRDIKIINLPSLHIVGDNDTLCSSIFSKQLVLNYYQPEFYHHRYGHVIPTDRLSREHIKSFIKRYI